MMFSFEQTSLAEGKALKDFKHHVPFASILTSPIVSSGAVADFGGMAYAAFQ
jgi:hypothetical protein